MKSTARLIASIFVLGAVNVACAQTPPVMPTVTVEKIAPGVAVLFGQGGNIGLSYGADGNVLIDDQFAPLTPQILAAVATIDPDPVQFLINTHFHGDHSGGNENLAKAGAIIVAQDNVRVRMGQENMVLGGKVAPSPTGALPIVTFAQDMSIWRNGDHLHIFYAPHAHTDGDAIIHFEKANVVHMGDTFFNGQYPFIDLDSGGSIDGIIAAADRVIAITNDQTRIIPGHGPVGSKANLMAYRAYLADVTAKVRAAIKSGKSLAQIQALKPSAAYDAKFGGGFIKPDMFVGEIYASLRKAPMTGSGKHH
jgi:cyclase